MPPDSTIRILVGEDEPLVREGIVRVLEEAGFEVVGVAGDADELVRKAGGHHPDVVLTDIQMPPDRTDDGLRAALRIRSAQPEVGVIVLSQFLEDRYALDLVGERAEGVGYLLKDRVGDLSLFVDAVQRVARGGSALDPAVVERMVGRRRARTPLDDLTSREREVMTLMAQGRSNQGIADELVVTTAAIERHVTSIFSKLDLRQVPQDHRRVLAVLEFLKRVLAGHPRALWCALYRPAAPALAQFATDERLRASASHARSGRAASVRRRASGARHAPASVTRQ